MRESKIADSMIIGPEFEFHVLDHISYECKPNRVVFEIDTAQAEWNSGNNDGMNPGYKVPLKGGYHISSPHDITYGLRSRMCLLKGMGRRGNIIITGRWSRSVGNRGRAGADDQMADKKG